MQDSANINRRYFPVIPVFFAVIFSALISPVVAQTDSTATDSTKGAIFDYSTARVQLFQQKNFGKFEPIDTSLNGFQQFNPARNQLFEGLYLGNLGAPSMSWFFNYQRAMGFDYGRHERDLYIKNMDDINYYRCNVPFTDLYYVAGSHGEQLFHVRHTRNIGPSANIALDYDKLSSDGYYQHTKNDYDNVSLSGWYHTPNEKYAVYAAGIHGHNKNDESGGVNNDTIFDYPQPNLEDPFRDAAFTEWKNWQGQIIQRVQFGSTKTQVINDSTQVNYFAPKFLVQLVSGAHDYYYSFLDPSFDQTYYAEVTQENDTLFDQSDVDGFYNRISIGSVPYHRAAPDSLVENHFQWEIYAWQQYHEVSDQTGTDYFRNMIYGAKVSHTTLFDSLIAAAADASIDQITGEYFGTASLRTERFFIQPEIQVTSSKLEPTQIQQHFNSFAESWDNNFKPVQLYQLRLTLHVPVLHTDLVLNQAQLKNYIFYSTVFYQKDGTATQFFIDNHLQLGDFRLNTAAGWQRASTLSSYASLIGKASWYYQHTMFKKALFFQSGLDVSYCDGATYTYDMLSGQFSNDGVGYASSGPMWYPIDQNLLFVDAFINLDIRTLRVFAKFDNVTAGLFNKGYYVSPYYPMQPRGFKLGLDWFLFY